MGSRFIQVLQKDIVTNADRVQLLISVRKRTFCLAIARDNVAAKKNVYRQWQTVKLVILVFQKRK